MNISSTFYNAVMNRITQALQVIWKHVFVSIKMAFTRVPERPDRKVGNEWCIGSSSIYRAFGTGFRAAEQRSEEDAMPVRAWSFTKHATPITGDL